MISLHAEVPADSDILTMHDIIDLIEHELREKLHCHAVIHMDPVCTADPETEHLKEMITGFLHEVDSQLTLHDFRIVVGATHTNIIFDVVLPFQYKMTDREIKDYLSSRIRQANSNYFAVIEVDHQYSKNTAD